MLSLIKLLVVYHCGIIFKKFFWLRICCRFLPRLYNIFLTLNGDLRALQSIVYYRIAHLRMISLFNARISCILYEVVQVLFCSCVLMDCSALGKQGKPHLAANILAKMFSRSHLVCPLPSFHIVATTLLARTNLYDIYGKVTIFCEA